MTQEGKSNQTSKEMLDEFMQSDTFKQMETVEVERRKTVKSGPDVIHLEYIGELTVDDLKEIDEELSKAQLKLSSYNKSGVAYANLDTFSLVSYLVISQPIITELLKGVGTNALWDVIKLTSIKIWEKVKGEKVTKYNKDGVVNQKAITFGLQVKLDQNTSINVELKGDVDKEIIAESLDKVLKFIGEQKLNEKYQITDYAHFDSTSKKWIKTDVKAEVNKMALNQQKERKKQQKKKVKKK